MECVCVKCLRLNPSPPLSLSRKTALLWEVVQIGRNAELYNEEGSLIVKHSHVLIHTLCKFITSTSDDPLLYYSGGTDGEGETEDG